MVIDHIPVCTELNRLAFSATQPHKRRGLSRKTDIAERLINRQCLSHSNIIETKSHLLTSAATERLAGAF